MGQDVSSGPLGIYLHIPFCLSRCGYCSFFSLPFSRSALAEYLNWLQLEIRLYQDEVADHQVDTLYLGGGTPSLLKGDEINSLCSGFPLIDGAEVTLEINPLQITEVYLKELGQTPVNRLSIGIQSLDDSELKYLGRRHRSAQIAGKIELCRKHGYSNLSLDLIYGLPGSRVSGLLETVQGYLELEPQHISAYLLTLDQGSPLLQESRLPEAPQFPDDDGLAEQYHALRQTLVQAGFEQYEISNFARPGFASRHNLKYWQSEPWIGFGASAAGWLPPLRYSNPADLQSYYRNVEEGIRCPDARECNQEEQQADFLMMGLRLTKGVSPSDYLKRFGCDLFGQKQDKINKLQELGMVETGEDFLRLSSSAMFVSNSVIGELL